MMKNIIHFTAIILLIFPLLLSAQKEKDSVALKAKIIFENKIGGTKNLEQPKTEKPRFEQPKDKSATFSVSNIGLTQPKSFNLPKYSALPKEKQKNIMLPEQFADNGKRFEKPLNKRLNGIMEEEGLKSDIVLEDIDFGIIKTKSEYVEISVRDFGAIDGDIIRIYLDNIVLKRGVFLSQFEQKIRIDLLEGENTIEIEALNQGEVGYNTAEYKLRDSTSLLLDERSWHLGKGYKGKLVIVREAGDNLGNK